MARFPSWTPGRLPVAGALAAQLGLLWWSLDGFLALSVFCTVAAAPLLWIFNALHHGYAGLLLLGLASLVWPPARLPYLALLALTLPALPVQAWLVRHGHLSCDGP